MPMRKLLLVAALAGLPAIGLPSLGNANDVYPSRPITVVVPFPAGGPTDAIVRLLGERMRVSLGQPLVVEYVTGAAGTIGLTRVARAAPDGYTIIFGHTGTHVLSGAFYALPFDLMKDFAPISLLPSNPYLLVTKSGVPAKDVRDLIAWLQQNGDKASQGIPGVNTGPHLAGKHFQSLTGTRFAFIPYRGSAPALQDLMAGQIDLMFEQVQTSLQHVRAGRIKAYAVTANTRLASAPDIPTTAEAGVPDLQMSLWYGLWATGGTPKDVVAKLNAAVVETLADPAVRQRLTELELDIPSRAQQTPEALAALQKADIEKWWPIVKASNMKPEAN
jgi:tripartite-type tricarboxylate transporter receptor subunit TctC